MFPTAIHLAAAEAVTADLLPALDHLAAALRAKADEFAKVVKSGRTHLMDATPVTLGQEFGGYAAQVARRPSGCESPAPASASCRSAARPWAPGINARPTSPARSSPGWPPRRACELVEARDHFAAQSARDALVEAVAASCARLAVALIKIANDLRWMGGGPPDRPGRDPPARPAAGLVDHARQGQPGAARGGHPGGRPGHRQRRRRGLRRLPGRLRAERLHAGDGPQPARIGPAAGQRSSRLFADRCVAGIEANVERCRAYAEASPSIGTSLNPYIGYERAAALVKESVATGRPIREIVLRTGLLDEELLDEALDVIGLTSNAPG